MDNITHSLIGLAIGEAVAVHRKKARLPIWIASAVANNLPDADLIVTTLFYPGNLGYLLHHRGHTHTLVAAPVLGALMLAFFWLYARNRPNFPWREVIFVSLLGGFFHLLADSWNSYGVHPFWPFDNRWYYGDMTFILEPWIWAITLPAIFFACTTRWGKGVCLGLLALILGLAAHHEYVTRVAALGLLLATILSFFTQWQIKSPGKRILASLSLLAFVLITMLGLSQHLHRMYASPGAEIALHPFPANPFCWSGLRARLNATEYRAEIFTAAPFPSFFSVDRCPSMLNPRITAPLILSRETDTSATKYSGEFIGTRAELEALANDCRGNAFLRYARIPFWRKETGGWIVGDLRYDRDEELGFTETLLPSGEPNCPTSVPPWIGKFHPENI